MPRVSILIPTYNQSGYVVQAVESALSQDYDDLEVVVSDDASSDDTQAVLERYRSHPRVHIFRNERNLGRVANYRESLYRRARGEWVLNLDGDDYLCDDRYISDALDLARRDTGVDLVFANVRRWDEADRSFRENTVNAAVAEITRGPDLFLLLPPGDINLYHATCLYKADKARSLDFYRRDILSADWESLHRYILSGKVGFVNRQVAVWRLHGRNATARRTAAVRADDLESIAGPYREAHERQVFPERVLQQWYQRMLFRVAAKDAQALLRRRDVSGFDFYMKRLRELDQSVHRKVLMTPKLLLRRLRTYLPAPRRS
jgi:glycosyltransferase involved in cell wall biosynthesis